MIDWLTIRYLIAYPLLMLAGVAWSLLLVCRWRRYAMPELVWSAIIGISLAVTGALGIVSLYLYRVQGARPITGPVVSLIPAVVVLIAAVHLFVREWRDSRWWCGRNGDDDGDQLD